MLSIEKMSADNWRHELTFYRVHDGFGFAVNKVKHRTCVVEIRNNGKIGFQWFILKENESGYEPIYVGSLHSSLDQAQTAALTAVGLLEHMLGVGHLAAGSLIIPIDQSVIDREHLMVICGSLYKKID